MLSTQCITLRLCTHAAFARLEPLAVYIRSSRLHFTSRHPQHQHAPSASELEIRTQRIGPPTNETKQTKNRPRERIHSRSRREDALGWRIRAQHAGSPAYNGPPLLFCTRPPRLQLNARYQHLSGEKQSLHGRPCVYTVLTRTVYILKCIRRYPQSRADYATLHAARSKQLPGACEA